MTTTFITNPKWLVYETTNKSGMPFGSLDQVVNSYEDYGQMIADYQNCFLDGTHNFFVEDQY